MCWEWHGSRANTLTATEQGHRSAGEVVVTKVFALSATELEEEVEEVTRSCEETAKSNVKSGGREEDNRRQKWGEFGACRNR